MQKFKPIIMDVLIAAGSLLAAYVGLSLLFKGLVGLPQIVLGGALLYAAIRYGRPALKAFVAGIKQKKEG